MIFAFLLIVSVNDQVVSDQRMLFRSGYRCNFFAHLVETGRHKPKTYDKIYHGQKNITAYCIPKMVQRGTTFYD